ncbi:MAG TPA: MAPEG family protein [Roseiarcus sp.]|nr:MAPEG family protein [Roseiarcus sp.]
MSELACLELGVLLWLVHLLVQVGLAQIALPFSWLVSARDERVAPKGLAYGRAERAMANYVQNFVAFAALDLAFIALHWSAGVWPTVWIAARIVYLPFYVFGVVRWRSLVWGVSLVAIVMMLIRLAFG